jgi:hypothetical protein
MTIVAIVIFRLQSGEVMHGPCHTSGTYTCRQPCEDKEPPRPIDRGYGP